MKSAIAVMQYLLAAGLILLSIILIVQWALASDLPYRPPSENSNEPLALGVIALILVWCACVGEPTYRFWVISRSAPAVQRARLRALSLGYGLIVAILIVAIFAGNRIQS